MGSIFLGWVKKFLRILFLFKEEKHSYICFGSNRKRLAKFKPNSRDEKFAQLGDSNHSRGRNDVS